MTIQSIRVAKRSDMVVERFGLWLHAHAEYVNGGLNLTNILNAKKFVEDNTQDLYLKIRDRHKDQLILTRHYGSQSEHYTVCYLEHAYDDDGEVYYSAVNSEYFNLDELHKAINAFVTRWESAEPAQCSSLLINV